MARPERASVALVLYLAGCAATTHASTGPSAPTGPVQVFAAASLTDAFKLLGAGFSRQDPGVTPAFNFAGSQLLVSQVQQGAPADVIATADSKTMKTLRDAGLLDGSSTDFAYNRLEIVVARGNPKHILGLSDLARPDLAVVLGAPQVPIGEYTRQALAATGVTVAAKSLELDVKAVLTRVSLGEADAGVVYETDISSAGAGIQGVEIPAGQNVRVAYPIAALRAAVNRAAARAFVQYVLSPRGRTLLVGLGFTVP